MKYILILTFLIISSSNALTKNLFDTDYYEVKFTSDNVENKKINNIKRIKFLSINKIFDNILIKEDYNIINKNLTEDLINTFIQNIVLKDEKIINNNYYSQIKINYNKKKIINYLRSNEFDYIEYIPFKTENELIKYMIDISIFGFGIYHAIIGSFLYILA